MQHHDLFGESTLPQGLAFEPSLIDEREEATLIAAMEQLSFTPFQFGQWEGKRETISFGWSYDFSGGGLGPAEPIPDFLLPVRAKAARFAGIAAEELVQALVIRYGPEAGIGWHRDRPVFGRVIGISLGSEATLRLRLRGADGFERASVALPPRSAYLLSGAARERWEHSIVPTGHMRWSITFRTLAARSRNEARK